MNKMLIATHDGQFHADEAFACALLRRTSKFASAEIIRSRKEEDWQRADIVVDVGMVYDPAKSLFDHHQPSFKEVFSPSHKTLLSSAGLIYKHFGKEIIENLVEGPCSAEQISMLHSSIYESFVESFDANDNGISAYPPETPAPAFSQGPTIFSQVRWLNPRWNLPAEQKNDSLVMERFERAISLIDLAFGLCLEAKILSSFPGKSLLKKYLDAREDPQILLMDEYLPWVEHLHILEDEMKGLSGGSNDGNGGNGGSDGKKARKEENSKCLFAVYPDSKRGWRIQAIPKYPAGSGKNSFENRKGLPSPWRGARDSEMDAITGVKGGIFVHRAGFIGGHLEREGAIELAKLAIAYEEDC